MQRLNEIKQVIKELEKSILNDEEFIPLSGPTLKNTIEDLVVARKVLLWVIQTQKRTKKQYNSKKLEDFNIENPVKDVK